MKTRLPPRRRMPAVLALLVLAAIVSGCGREQRLAEQAAAQAAAAEAAAQQGEAAFEAALAQRNWALAKAQGDVLLAQYPRSQAAARVQPQLAQVAAQAAAQRAQARLAALWSYQRQAEPGGTQVSASLYAREEVDVDGSGPTPVRLIFRDHPAWGKSAYLVLQAGDFDCYGGCKVQVAVDAGAPRPMAASRPDTDAAIAMFIEDERALWRMTRTAQTLRIEFPVAAGGRRAALFEVAGLDRAQLPGWD